MNKQKKLTIQMGIFSFFVIIFLSVIVVTEKAGGILSPKIEEKIKNYLETNYSDIKNEFKENKITYKEWQYQMKITNKLNKNHYFYVTYKNGKITDTYKKDYKEGNQILNKIKNDLEQDINKETNINCQVEIISKLNDYTLQVQKQIIKEENLQQLKFYYIKKELIMESLEENEILNKIIEIISKMSEQKITPKYYNFIITNKNDITESIEISNITADFINNPYKIQIINDIINDNNTKLLKENKITYKYLN